MPNARWYTATSLAASRTSRSAGAAGDCRSAGRGAAFGDLDNDGDMDIVVNNMHTRPDLYRLDSPAGAHWITLKLDRHTFEPERHWSARSAVQLPGGVQLQEVRGGGSYYSQTICGCISGSDDRRSMERLEIRWPNGLEEQWTESRRSIAS